MPRRGWPSSRERRGRETVLLAFDEVLAYAERRAREALTALPDGAYAAHGELEGDGVDDEDIAIAVSVRIDGDSMTSTSRARRPRCAAT